MLDTGAIGETFIDRATFKVLKSRMNLEVYRLPRPVTANGFSGKPADTITEVFKGTLSIDGRRVPTWFIVTDLGQKYDIYLGLKWFEKNATMIDPVRKRLIWPKVAPTHHAPADLLLSPPIPINPEHQEDMERREWLHARQQDSPAPNGSIDFRAVSFVQKGREPIILSPEPKDMLSQPPPTQAPCGPQLKDYRVPTHERDLKTGLSQMERELSVPASHQLPPPPKIKPAKPLEERLQIAGLDFAFINGPAFNLHALRARKSRKTKPVDPSLELGAVTLQELNKLIDDDPLPDDEEEMRQLVQKLLPEIGRAHV